MKRTAAFAAVALLTLGACQPKQAAAPQAKVATSAAPITQAAVADPRRRPGLWEISVWTPRGYLFGPRECVGPTTDADGGFWKHAISAASVHCYDRVVGRRADGGWDFRETCPTVQGAKQKITAQVVGNLDRQFEIRSTSTVEDAKTGPFEPMQGSDRMGLKRVGECLPGQKPGDVFYPKTMTLHKRLDDGPSAP